MTDRGKYLMTTDREAHLGRIIQWFGSLVTPKYKKGQEEHGGSMWEKPGMLRNLQDETLDFVTYLQTIQEQLKERYPEAYAFLMGEEVPMTRFQQLEDIGGDDELLRVRKRPRIYVAGPYSAEDNNWQVDMNIQTAATFARRIWRMGGAAFCPHLNTQRFDGPDLDWQAFLDGDFEWIAVSDALFLVPGWQDSKGAVAEEAYAQSLKIPVFESATSLEDWIQEWSGE